MAGQVLRGISQGAPCVPAKAKHHWVAAAKPAERRAMQPAHFGPPSRGQSTGVD